MVQEYKSLCLMLQYPGDVSLMTTPPPPARPPFRARFPGDNSLLLALTAEELRLYIPAPLANQFPTAKYLVVRHPAASCLERALTVVS